MSFQSIPEILDILQLETSYLEQPLQHLLNCWQQVVGKVKANHTQPISIENDILWVATSSAAWAQNLTFERKMLLKKLNKILPSPLVNIRFSTARWQDNKKKSSPQPTNISSISSQQHPSYLGNNTNKQSYFHSLPKNPNTVFANWAENIKTRSQYLPLCPNCQSPTPAGELKRWGVCSICAAKSFAINSGS